MGVELHFGQGLIEGQGSKSFKNRFAFTLYCLTLVLNQAHWSI